MPRRLRIGYPRSVRISGDLGSYASSGQDAAFVHQYAITMTGPTTGQQGVASTNFTIGSTRAVGTSIIVTPSDSGQFGTFTPTTVTLTTGSPTSTFTYTPISTGSKTISVTNDQGQANPVSITYVSTLSLPVFTQASPPSGTIDVAYSYQFVATEAVSYSLVSGTLPAGLTLSSSGLLSGTPTTVETYSFTVGATNAFGTTTTDESVSVSAGASNPTFTSLDSGLGVNGAPSVTTTSVTLTANRLCLLTIVNAFSGGTPNIPTCSGWTLVTTVVEGNIARMTVLRRMVTSDLTQSHVYDFAGQNQNFTKWAISQSSADVDTSGTNGSGAIVQSATNSFLELTPNPTPQYASVTLPAFASAANSTFAVFGGSYATYTPTVGDGFVQLATPGVGSSAYALITEYKAANDTVVDATWSGEADVWVGAALEIRASYNLAAVIAAIRADSAYGSYWTDTSDVYAPNGLQLPTAPQGVLTTVNVSSLASLRAELASGTNKHVILAPGSYTEASSVAVVVDNAQDMRVTLTGCTITCNKSAGSDPEGGGGLNVKYRARRIEIVGGSFDAGYGIWGHDIKLYGVSFVVSRSDSALANVGLVGGHRICWERCTSSMFNGGPSWVASTYDSFVNGSVSGTTLTVNSVTGMSLAVGSNVESFSVSNMLPGTRITAFGTGTGGVGTYTVNNNHSTPTSTGNIKISTRSTNIIFANSIGIATTGSTGSHENMCRYNAVNFGLQVDSRLRSEYTFAGTGGGKPTTRITSNTATQSNCKTVGVIRCQVEGTGLQTTDNEGIFPAVENVIVDAYLGYYFTPNGNGSIMTPTRFPEPGVGTAVGNGTTATYNYFNSGAHGLSNGEVVEMRNGGSFGVGAVAITVINATQFTYPCTASGTGNPSCRAINRISTDFFYMRNSTMYKSEGNPGNGTGFVPSDGVFPSWTTVLDATTSLANGNQWQASATPPTWDFR